jgi:hypothetical protein
MADASAELEGTLQAATGLGVLGALEVGEAAEVGGVGFAADSEH